MSYNLIAIIGATASGKTRTAVHVAKAINGEIISADSRQVYRGMDLGTGKDLQEYEETPYHLIDICDPGEAYDVFQYQQDVYKAIANIQNRDKQAILCGGSSMYISAVLNQYELQPAPRNDDLHDELANLSLSELQQQLLQAAPNQHNTTDMLDKSRLIRAIEIAKAPDTSENIISHPDLRPLVIALLWEREERRERIKTRLQERLDEGMLDEVMALHRAGVSWEKLDYFGLEYRFIAQYLQNKLSYNDMFQKLNSAIAKFAKKQDTWLRKLEREGLEIHWVDGGDAQSDTTLSIIKSALTG